MEGAKLHRVAYPHLLSVRRLSRLLHVYMQPMAAEPATHAHYCPRTLAANLDMADYILVRRNITRRQYYDNPDIPLLREYIDTLVLGSLR